MPGAVHSDRCRFIEVVPQGGGGASEIGLAADRRLGENERRIGAWIWPEIARVVVYGDRLVGGERLGQGSEYCLPLLNMLYPGPRLVIQQSERGDDRGSVSPGVDVGTNSMCPRRCRVGEPNAHTSGDGPA